MEKITAGVRVGIIDGNYISIPLTRSARPAPDLIVPARRRIVMWKRARRKSPRAGRRRARGGAHGDQEIVAASRTSAGPSARRSPVAEEGVATSSTARWKRSLRPLSEAMRTGQAENYDRVDQCSRSSWRRCRGEVQRKVEATHLPRAERKRCCATKCSSATSGSTAAVRQNPPYLVRTSVLPRVHGSVVFTRGETQALVTCTLGTADDEQKIEHVSGEFYKRFMLHYNFPPFSVGEVQFLRGPGRREVGHGALAERALSAVVPGEDKFSYTVRLVSDILESNGVVVDGVGVRRLDGDEDAGVPIKAPVPESRWLHHGREVGPLGRPLGHRRCRGHYGDMDFKVAATAAGITALQMDIKVTGITSEIMSKALDQARVGRLHILGEMAKTLGATRGAMS